MKVELVLDRDLDSALAAAKAAGFTPSDAARFAIASFFSRGVVQNATECDSAKTHREHFFKAGEGNMKGRARKCSRK